MRTQTPGPGEPLPDATQLEALNAAANQAARMLKLLASEQRLRMLCRLGEGEASVGELAHYAGLAQSATSQHLAKLRAEGIVAVRREGQTIYYRLSDPAAVRMIEALCEVYGPA
jgi:DNA-binding transcriptional ArsR family regulator